MRVNRAALVLLLAAMAIIIFANVVLRYTTSQSIEWAEEVSRYLMVWLTFLGAGPVLRYGGHIAVENLQDALPPRAACALRALIAVILMSFFAFMVWFGLLYLERVAVPDDPHHADLDELGLCRHAGGRPAADAALRAGAAGLPAFAQLCAPTTTSTPTRVPPYEHEL